MKLTTLPEAEEGLSLWGHAAQESRHNSLRVSQLDHPPEMEMQCPTLCPCPHHSPRSRWFTVAPYRQSSFRGHWEEPQQAQRLGS